jgi:hypothetical protein
MVIMIIGNLLFPEGTVLVIIITERDYWAATEYYILFQVQLGSHSSHTRQSSCGRKLVCHPLSSESHAPCPRHDRQQVRCPELETGIKQMCSRQDTSESMRPIFEMNFSPQHDHDSLIILDTDRRRKFSKHDVSETGWFRHQVAGKVSSYSAGVLAQSQSLSAGYESSHPHYLMTETSSFQNVVWKTNDDGQYPK